MRLQLRHHASLGLVLLITCMIGCKSGGNSTSSTTKTEAPKTSNSATSSTATTAPAPPA